MSDPVPYEDQFRVQRRWDKEGGECYYMVVDAECVPVGPMRHFYGEAIKIPLNITLHPFPRELMSSNVRFESEEEAEEVCERMRKHVIAVKHSLPIKKRVGSSKWWDHPAHLKPLYEDDEQPVACGIPKKA